ncbi:Heat-labile enterotoxin IIB A chain [Colletotrichum gloeosporioides]|uniref:Heat-labile enterotoxin IIB A chain n=1 Tax=Colletotrichum gloeosporioides TaxID=474922 RepID=A0A8H4CRA1_COLGL|nr:Heat-labile enterotoxin IIB A chain [Colletotrichum gloeosporioides]KAF3808447.1 Heat-labile enterotoxin IIB A chain [Colletotrichum gloeosporioides]
MVFQKNILILFVLNLTPTEMRAAGNFAPRGASRFLEVTPNVSMYNHAVGAESGASRDNDGYVSTTASEDTAVRFLTQMFGGNGYVYEIAAAGNFIQVSGTLGQFSPYPNEQEYAALGGFSWDQVIRWRHYTNGVADAAGMEDNNVYEGRIYNSLRPNNGQPSLAGFPAGHRAWTLSPWNAFAQGGEGCGGNGELSVGARRLKARQCAPVDNAFTAASRFLDDACYTKALCG